MGGTALFLSHVLPNTSHLGLTGNTPFYVFEDDVILTNAAHSQPAKKLQIIVLLFGDNLFLSTSEAHDINIPGIYIYTNTYKTKKSKWR